MLEVFSVLDFSFKLVVSMFSKSQTIKHCHLINEKIRVLSTSKTLHPTDALPYFQACSDIVSLLYKLVEIPGHSNRSILGRKNSTAFWLVKIRLHSIGFNWMKLIDRNEATNQKMVVIFRLTRVSARLSECPDTRVVCFCLDDLPGWQGIQNLAVSVRFNCSSV